MKESLIANRYAKALFLTLDKDVERAKRCLELLGSLSSLFNENKIRKILVSPVVPLDLKTEVFKYVFDKVEHDRDVENFINSIIQKGRIEVIPSMTSSFKGIVNEIEGIAQARLVTAVELQKNELDQFVNALEAVAKKKVLIDHKTDKSILGGFIVNIGSKRVDFSLKTQLEAIVQSAVR